MHVQGSSPILRIDDSTSTGNYLNLSETSGGKGKLNYLATTGAASIIVEPIVSDTTSSGSIEMFLNTNTSGAKALKLYKGNNSATQHAQIGVDGQDSYFQIGGGNVGIGTTSPSSKLTVAGTIESTTGGVRFPDGTVQTTATGGGSGGTIVNGWPDVIVCNITNPSIGVTTFYLTVANYALDGLYYYRRINSSSNHELKFNADGSFNSYGTIVASNCATSIAALYTAGQAFQNVGGGSFIWTVSGSNTYYSGGNVGIGTTIPPTKLTVSGTILSEPSTITGSAVDLKVSNTLVLTAVSSSTITLSNMVHGGNYTLIIKDNNSRTYDFVGCDNALFKPTNGPTIVTTQSIYNIMTVSNGSGYDCYVTWASGYQ